MGKKYFFVVLIIFSMVILGCQQSVQPQKQNSMMEKESGEMAEIGFEMMNGKMMMVNEKTKTQAMMETDAKLNDGTKVMMNGKVIRANGTSFMLQDNESIWMDGSFMKGGEMMEDKSMMKISYKGKVLAGTTSLYIEFNKDDYEKALKENKKILLYFYASWCPTCKAEQPNTFAAFNELKDSNLIGFRVNFKDSDTDADEEALAKQFGIAYQHTKAILKDGQNVGKWPDSWDKQRYLDEIAKV